MLGGGECTRQGSAATDVTVNGALDDVGQHWQSDALFTPDLGAAERRELLRGWQKAVSRVLETGKTQE